MRAAIIALVFAAMQVSTQNSSESYKPALHLVLSPEHTDAISGKEFTLTLKITNLSETTVFCSGVMEGNLNLMYEYDIRTESGKRVSRIQPHEMVIVHGCSLSPGSSNNTSLSSLMSAFDMQTPGKYSIQVSRWDPIHPKELRDTSNIVEVIVKAAR